jgi:hypothetical protein
MRVGPSLPLWALLSLTLSPQPAAAQSTPAGSSSPQTSPEKTASITKLQEALKAAQARSDRPGTGSPDGAPSGLQSWLGLLSERQRNEPATVVTRPPGEAPNCAHIVIYRAPEMDSEMILPFDEAPGEPDGSMPTFKALPPCSRDLRPAIALHRFPGVMVNPRGGPFFQPSLVKPSPAQPKANHAPVQPQEVPNATRP